MKTIPIHLMKGRKAQTAVELLTVYGWVVLLILVVVIIMYSLGYLNLPNWLPPYCNITPTMSCRTYRFGYAPDGKSMVLVYRIVNGLGYDILFPANSTTLEAESVGKVGKMRYNGTCYPIAYPIKAGTPLSCIIFISDSEVIPDIGKNLDFKITIRYRNCNAIPDYAKTGNCTGAPEYTVSGSIRTPMESAVPSLYACGDGICDYPLGENPTNCCLDCPVSHLDLTADPNPVDQWALTKLTATARYVDGSPAANATVMFGRDRAEGWNMSDFLEAENSTTNSSIANSNGEASANYGSQVAGIIRLNASSCGPNASAVVQINVAVAPPNGTIVFTYPPDIVPAGGYYDVNVTVYNTTGDVVPNAFVYLRSDNNSAVEPVSGTTNDSGILAVRFYSNITHVGRLVARSVGIWNATNINFGPAPGRIILFTSGDGELGSEGVIHVYGCLYDVANQPLSDKNLNLRTTWGYFLSSTGQQKLPGLTSFTSKVPTLLFRVEEAKVSYEVFGYNGSADGHSHGMQQIADPIEFDAYAGKFFRAYMTDASRKEDTRAQIIAQYINLKYKTAIENGERTVYIFYNLSYEPSCNIEWVNARTFYGNLTKYLNNTPPVGIIKTDPVIVDDPDVLVDIMLNNANRTILISANGQLPGEVYNCESDGGNAKKFFERGGVMAHTGNWEFGFPLYVQRWPGDAYHADCYYDDQSGSQGGEDVFGWYTGTGWTESSRVVPAMRNDTIIAKTFYSANPNKNGCFDSSSEHPLLFSDTLGYANITATFYSFSNSTLVEFVRRNCSSSTYGVGENETCFNPVPAPNAVADYCISGQVVERCQICGCDADHICNQVTGECIDKPGGILLYLRTFNGTGSTLPNDEYTRLQVIAQVLNKDMEPMVDIDVNWTSDGVLIEEVTCNGKTGGYCGDYSALPSPENPRAAIYVASNGTWAGMANVTATVDISGIVISSSINITVYDANKTVGNRRWRQAVPTLMPADNYTNATLCVAAFNLNDSAVGNITVCFNTSLGTFNNGKKLYCTGQEGLLHTDMYGELCIQLKSDTFGDANVSALIENFTEGTLINTTYWLYTKISFYQLPSSIEIKLDPTVSAPCESASYPKCSSSLIRINATFRNSTGAAIPGIPYVYFGVPRPQGWTWPNVIFWFSAGLVEPYWWSSGWEKLIPSYVDMADQGLGSYCGDALRTNNTCSATTDVTGSAYSNFTPTYPAGAYNLTVGTFYRCGGVPYSPTNCMLDFTNVTLLNVSPIPQTIIINSTRQIKPDNIDSQTLNFTMYGSDGSPLEAVFFRGYVKPCGSGKCPTFKDTDSKRYWLNGQDGDVWSWYTNSSGRGAVRDVKCNVSGNYTLIFETYYVSMDQWITVSNSTQLFCGPNVSTIIVNASPNTTYGDGVSYSNITVTVFDSDGGRMRNVSVTIGPPTMGQLDCCRYDGCSCTGKTNVNGVYNVTMISSLAGDSNISAYIEYSDGTTWKKLYNSTNITFKPPPNSVVVTANPSTIDGDGISKSRITARFVYHNYTDGTDTPTPGLNVTCNVSDKSVFFPVTGLVTDSDGKIYSNLSSIENPATVMCYYLNLALGSTDISVLGVGQNPGTYNISMIANQTQTQFNRYSLVSAIVKDKANGDPIADDTTVTFMTSYGGKFENCGCNKTTAKTLNGNASVNVTAWGVGSIFVKANVSGDWGVTDPPLAYTS